jgi:nitrogen PTS system EIIA component
MTERLLAAEEVARWMGVTVEWVHTMARRGEMPAMKLGRYWRFDRTSVEAWLRERQGLTYKRRTG